MQEDKRRLGRIAYEAYCQETGWKSAITGADLPPFYNTPEIVQTAWMRAVHAILSVLRRAPHPTRSTIHARGDGAMSNLHWRKIEEQKPEHDQECLRKMKHGIISGYYNAEERTFRGYYWSDIEWSAYEWVPIEEAQ